MFGMIDTVLLELVGLDVANHKQHEHKSIAYREVEGKANCQ